MNEETSGGQRRRRVGILAGIGLLAAACGGGVGHHSQAPGAQSTGSYYQQAVTFSKCMRSHGDPAFPDPGPEGAFPNNNGSLDKNSSQFKTAQAACKNLEPGDPPASQFQQGYKQLLKYSACMRSHGMPKFPDPTLDAHGVGYSGDMGRNLPQFKTANQACKSLAPSGS